MRVVTDRPPAEGSAAGGPVVLDTRGKTQMVGGDHRVVLFGALVVVAAFAGSLLLSRRTALWLDEAQTVSISELALPDLLSALRTDGSPPLYYLLLHAWMNVFGTADVAARSLSTVAAIGAVALVPFAARRLGGRRAAAGSMLLLASVPFMHRYGTEVRMYTVVVLLTVAWVIFLQRSIERSDRSALAGVAALTGLLLLTHYWAFFLVAVAAAGLAVLSLRAASADGRRQSSRALAAMAIGALAFLPWAPSFLFQLRHTGAPWGGPAGSWIFEASLRGLVGDRGGVGLLGFLVAGLAAVGLWGRASGGGRVELDLAGRAVARPLAFLVGGTLTLAFAVSQLTDTAFASRYAAVVVAPFVLLAAQGLSIIEHRFAAPLVVAVLVAVGSLHSFNAASAARTQAPRIAAELRSRARPGDVVAFCPDQLAPAVVRLIGSSAATIVAYPPGSTGSRVNWVDYLERARRTPPARFAASLDEHAPDSTVWLVWSPNYRAVGGSCQAVISRLRRLRPEFKRAVAEDYSAFEHASLWRFPPIDN